MGIQDNIKNGLIVGTGLPSVPTNSPAQYTGHLHEYYAGVSEEFIQQYARYASDFFEAQMQGLNPDDIFEFSTVRMRMSDIVKPSAATIQYADDYKNVLIESKSITYIRPGTKFVVMGNTWLATNPNNVSSGDGSGIIRRCNAVWNHLDYYGNVLSEPIIVEKSRASANDNDYQEMGLITKGYFDVRCQYNPQTEQLSQNSRMILGSGAYQITGFSDFTQEFTGDYDSIRILDFTVRYEEPNLEIDDMANHVAGGKKFSWDIQLECTSPIMKVGDTATIVPTSIRNNETVYSSTDNPISYIWESSNENCITVDADGNVEAVGLGMATVRCKLEQNPTIHENYTFQVEAIPHAPHVQFTSTIPEFINAYDVLTIEAVCFDNGEPTQDIVDWVLSGADEGSYTYRATDNSLRIYCWSGSVTPLNISASFNGHGTTTSIELRGI